MIALLIILSANTYLFYSCNISRKTQIDSTLDTLLSDTLGLNYSVVSSEYSGIFGFDPSASYWVKLDKYSKNKDIQILEESNVPWQDEIDVEKRYIKNTFQYQDSLNNFSLYELEIGLKESTLCNRKSACNYFLLRKIGNENLFVSIVKF